MDVPQHIAFPGPTLAREDEASTCDDRFAALVTRQSRFVFRVAYAVLRNAHDAEDVVQETFLKIYRAQRWDRIENEKAFLARTAWRLAVDRRKSHKDSSDIEMPSTLENTVESPEQTALTAEWNNTVHRLIDALPEDLRQPLALASIDGLKSPEIAAAIGIPEGTVRTRLMRARQILKQKLAALMEGSS